MEKEEYIKKWIEGTLTQEEKVAFEKTEDYHALEKLSNALQAFKAPEYNPQQELEKLHANKKRAQGKTVHVNWFNSLMKIAATLVVMAGVYFYFFYSAEVTIETSFADRKEVVLPDSSIVILNALSSISYSQGNWEQDREVELHGEGFFKVKKGSRFSVETSSGTVTVLGTQFNVKDRENFFEVVCFEGLVQVSASDHEAKLSQKHMFRLVDGQLFQEANILAASPAWIGNESAFESVPFIQVVDEFERQYGVTVVTEGIALGQTFTGKFTHGDLTLALKSIAYPLNLEYEILDNQKIILKSNGE
ncbi:FecR family protein [Fulvivirga sp. 29W222]|uniref:FecR family protein n=1 Tax=Fulvivirga marina TaxID=2494733 RepID=A0A937FX61_9BACT|nr:FecR family protein [Fulvivirga marina]MBL6447689.1 FecR family protein [Fulvivirga marina]